MAKCVHASPTRRNQDNGKNKLAQLKGRRPITVQELIDQLQGLPPTDVVLVEGYENGLDLLIAVRLRGVGQAPGHGA